MASTLIVLGVVLGVVFLLYGYLLNKDKEDAGKVKNLAWISFGLGFVSLGATGWYVFHRKKKSSLEDLSAEAAKVSETSAAADAVDPDASA